ncbi:MAG: hypothetical protein NE328_20550 [Lentisphaeraceae bacterium]|nr:hypothetical protein [Lentisphaeraceae bacterium]
MKYLKCTFILFSLILLYFSAVVLNQPREELTINTTGIEFPLGTSKEFIDMVIQPKAHGNVDGIWLYIDGTRGSYFNFKFDDDNKLIYQHFIIGCIRSKKKTLKDWILMKSHEEMRIEKKQMYIDKIAHKIQGNIQKYKLEAL